MKNRWQISTLLSKRFKLNRLATKVSKGDSSKRVWNSLEAARIGVSVFTALSVVALGYVVTRSNTEDERAYQAQLRRETREAERQARLDAQAREERLALATEAKATRDRVAASLEARRLRDETTAREEATRRATEEREARLRSEARTEALQSRILEHRIQVWNQVAPIVARLYRNMRIDLRVEGAEERRALAAQSQALLELATTVEAYRPYFSEEFNLAFRDFSRAAEDVLQHSRTPSGPGIDQQRQLGRAYSRLLAAARADLAVPRRSD